jgi:sugar lactone lactonase YvrE
VDTGNKRIAKWSPDGVALETYGTFGTGEGEFDEPSSISIAPEGDIYVADYWNQRIQHFDSDFEYIDEIEIPSWGSHGITDRAYIVAIDEGRLLATDPANGRIAVFDAEGVGVASWRIAEVEIPSRPIGIAWDGDGDVYISDALISDDQPVEAGDVSGALVRVPLSALLPRAQSTGTP